MKVYLPEELSEVAGDKYRGVVAAAKYARELNSLPLQRSPYAEPKLTTLALETLVSGEIDFRITDRRPASDQE